MTILNNTGGHKEKDTYGTETGETAIKLGSPSPTDSGQAPCLPGFANAEAPSLCFLLKYVLVLAYRIPSDPVDFSGYFTAAAPTRWEALRIGHAECAGVKLILL